jgi:Periplasmic binding protein
MRSLVRSSLALLLASLASLASLAGCNVFRSTNDCKVDGDCARGTVCSVDGAYCRTAGPIQLGVLLPLTGNQAGLSPTRLQGIRFGTWLVDRDPARRVLDRGLSFSIEDTLGDIGLTQAATTKLFEKNVLAIVGPASSAEVLKAQELTFAQHLVQIAPAAGASDVGDVQPGGLRARYLFQLSTEIKRGSLRGLPLFLADSARPAAYDVCYDGIALVVTDDATGRSYEAGLEELLPPNCVPVTKKIVVPRDKKGDYSAEIAELASVPSGAPKTRCLFLAVRPDVAGELLRALKAYEKGKPAAPYSAFLGSSLLYTPSFIEESKSAVLTEPTLAEGFHGFDSDWAPERATFRDLEALWQEYLAAHPEEVGEPTLGVDVTVWAEAIVMLGLAIELAGTTDDPVALRDALIDIAQPDPGDLVIGPREIPAAVARIRAARASGIRAGIDFRGAGSNNDFDERGFVDHPTGVWRVKGGAVDRFTGYAEEALATVVQKPGPACARKPK